jgi:class 3 adenylate cyclase
LFTDFVNFTGITQTSSPERLVSEVHLCYTAFDDIMERNGMEKIKTIGDAYLAVSGIPNADKDHVLRAVRASREIIAFVNKRKQDEGMFDIRIGLSSGTVVAGIVGIKKFAYDIWGDAVNTPARMELNSEPAKIKISGETYKLIKGQVVCIRRGKIIAKNKGEIDMYFVE